MKFIRKFMKKELNECLKEEKMYTIKDDHVLAAYLNLNSAMSSVEKLVMTCNMLEDRLEHPTTRGIEEIDFELMKLELDYLQKKLEGVHEILPDRRYR